MISKLREFLNGLFGEKETFLDETYFGHLQESIDSSNGAAEDTKPAKKKSISKRKTVKKPSKKAGKK